MFGRLMVMGLYATCRMRLGPYASHLPGSGPFACLRRGRMGDHLLAREGGDGEYISEKGGLDISKDSVWNWDPGGGRLCQAEGRYRCVRKGSVEHVARG